MEIPASSFKLRTNAPESRKRFPISQEIIGDGIDRRAAWKQGPDVSHLADQPVRLRFGIADADLFALRFRK